MISPFKTLELPSVVFVKEREVYVDGHCEVPKSIRRKEPDWIRQSGVLSTDQCGGKPTSG